jgi:hypothetical protein
MLRLFIYIVVTLVLQFLLILLTGRTIEHGDINAASMYPIVFFIPSIIISFALGLAFLIVNRLKSNTKFVITAFLIFILLIILNEVLCIKGFVIYRIVLIFGFLFNLIVFGYNRIKK